MNSRAWYEASFDEFRSASPDSVFGKLAQNPEFDLVTTQREAWNAQIDFLQQNLDGLAGTLYLEFNIPRMGSRVDTVLLSGRRSLSAYRRSSRSVSCNDRERISGCRRRHVGPYRVGTIPVQTNADHY